MGCLPRANWARLPVVTDLRERVPAQSLIEQLLHQWDIGAIHPGTSPGEIVIDDEARSWYQGVLGERRVAQLLAQLGPQWTVLHSVPFGRGSTDIDHVVIGPGGVFVINTKYSPGKDVWSAGVGMFVGGHKQRYVTRSLDEARDASRRLTTSVGQNVPVFGVVVFVDPGEINRKETAGVEGQTTYVLRDDELLPMMRSGQMFSPDEIESIVASAVRPGTWHINPQFLRQGNHVAAEFDALEAAAGPGIRAGRPAIGSDGVAPSVPSRQRKAAAARPTSVRYRSSRPNRPAQRKRTPRKKQSPLEKLLVSVTLPIVGFIIVAIYLSSLGHQ